MYFLVFSSILSRGRPCIKRRCTNKLLDTEVLESRLPLIAKIGETSTVLVHTLCPENSEEIDHTVSGNRV